MKCSQYGKCQYSCDGIVPRQITDVISSGLNKAIANNKLPEELASKILVLVSEGLDGSDFCNKVFAQQRNILKPKIRVLDRAIVHKFEQYYDKFNVLLNERNHSTVDIGGFFNTIPRGECLDIFLDVVKSHCIGDDVQVNFVSKLERLTDNYSHNKTINWQGVYQSKEYEIYMDEFFSIFFNRIKDHSIPIPALNNRLRNLHHPKRINKVLKYMSKLWHLKENAD